MLKFDGICRAYSYEKEKLKKMQKKSKEKVQEVLGTLKQSHVIGIGTSLV